VCRGFYGDAFDAELGARDLGLQRHEPLPDLGRRRVDSHQRLAVFHGERHPRRRVVVEARGEADVLEADRVADPAPDVLPVGDVRDAAGELAQVAAR
jgi:hypothetical protein